MATNQLPSKDSCYRRIRFYDMENLIAIIGVFFFCNVFLFCAQELSYPFVYKLENAPTIYAHFVKKYNKTFKGQSDYQKRYFNFLQTLRKVNRINLQPNSMKVQVNRYADLSKEDFPIQKQKIDPELAKIIKKQQTPNLESLFKFAF